MKFSLILATLNRTVEVEYFLQTLDCQTYRNFELIVVDQNLDDRLITLLEPYQGKFPILHLRSEKGLSRARNVGLKNITGDVVAFPDDDCAYLPDTLNQVFQLLGQNPRWGGLTGRSIFQSGEESGGHWADKTERIDFFNVWQRGISYTIFLRQSVVAKTGAFDEGLGVGANTPWSSGEETDYLLRAIDAGLYHDPSVVVIHPVKVKQSSDKPTVQTSRRYLKTYLYALGRGYVLRKHSTPLWFVLYDWSRPLIGMILSLFRGRLDKTYCYWETLRGRVQGWFGWA